MSGLSAYKLRVPQGKLSSSKFLYLSFSFWRHVFFNSKTLCIPSLRIDSICFWVHMKHWMDMKDVCPSQFENSPASSRAYRIIEIRKVKLEGAYKAIKSNPLLSAGIQSKHICQVIFFKVSDVGAFNNSQDNWFHCHTALTVRKFFLIFNRNLASFDLCPALCDDWEQILPLLCMIAFQIFEKCYHVKPSPPCLLYTSPSPRD